jgi:tetratricopeptide (TPR) repeat protein
VGSLSQAEVHSGVAMIIAGRYSEADGILRSSLQKLHQLVDRFNTVYATLYLGVCQRQRGQFTQAQLTLQEALELARSDGYVREEMLCLANLGILALLDGKTNQSLELLQHSVDGFRQMKFTQELAMALGGLSLAQHASGEKKSAQATLCEALRLAAASHNRIVLLTIPASLVIFLADEKKWDLAAEAYTGSLTEPLVANSHCFSALVGNRIDLACRQLSGEAWHSAEASGTEGDLFETFSRLAQYIESWSSSDEHS